MKKRVLFSTLSSILNYLSFTLLLLLSFKQSHASHRWKDENIIQSYNLSKTIGFGQKERETSYGDFDALSKDILFYHILPYCDHNIIKVNRSFFTLVTGYESEHIFDQGFENRPKKPVCCLFSSTVFDFRKHQYSIEQIPSFVWYSLIRKVENIPAAYWLYLKESQIHTVNLSGNRIEANSARALGESLKGTQVQTVNLYNSQIGVDGVRAFGQSLKGTQVQIVDLNYNQIGAEGARAFGQSLQGTQVQTVYLGNNQIGAEGVRYLGQVFKEILTLDLSNNNIGDEGVRNFGQSLQSMRVQTLNLSWNMIGDDGTYILGKVLKDTQVQTLDLSANNISQDIQETLREMLPGIKIIFDYGITYTFE